MANANQLDTDGHGQGNVCDDDDDGVEDSKEAIDGTNPLDAGSALLTLVSPAFSSYDTTLNQKNFLELLSIESSTAKVKVTVYSKTGARIGSARSYSLSRGQRANIDISTWINKLNTYGLIKVEYNSSAALFGRTVLSRQDVGEDGIPAGEQSYGFVYAKELRNPRKGIAYALADSKNSDRGAPVVTNLIELINLESVKKTFTVKIYDKAGALKYNKASVVNPLSELNLAGGNQFG
ncbi:MAG: hypothetical protein IT292_07160 [Deltaproteobacteria bacterium]|nr:hypothetical protein [Deltaproteobacteria bacterium]